jgi:hypothetical protein
LRTGSQVTGFDDFGRVTDMIQHNAGDTCTQTDYATPVPDTPVRVLSAIATRTVTDCHDVTLTKVSFEYDHKKPTNDDPAVRVSDGFVTSSTVTRYDLDGHNPPLDIRLFDKDYNPDGTLHSTTRTRDDGATQIDTVDYDGFGLVVIRATSAAYDPVGGAPGLGHVQLL